MALPVAHLASEAIVRRPGRVMDLPPLADPAVVGPAWACASWRRMTPLPSATSYTTCRQALGAAGIHFRPRSCLAPSAVGLGDIARVPVNTLEPAWDVAGEAATLDPKGGASAPPADPARVPCVPLLVQENSPPRTPRGACGAAQASAAADATWPYSAAWLHVSACRKVWVRL